MSNGQPTPEPDEHDVAKQRRVDEDAMRYPGHERPDEAREAAGLDAPRSPDPEGAPLPDDAGRGTPVPLERDEP